MQKNRKFTALLLAILVLAGMFVRFLVIRLPQKAEQADIQPGVSYLASQAKEDVAARESTVQAAKVQFNSIKTQESQFQNFRTAITGVLIVGDSLVKAISEYGVLNAGQVIAKVGAGTKYLDEKQEEIIAKHPKYLILHLGENALDGKERADVFVRAYADNIRTLQQKLPDTKIFVDGIFPVQAFACEKEPGLTDIAYYNSKLQTMAQELQVTYLDYTSLLPEGSDCYGADGIHLNPSFYKDRYLPMIMQEIEDTDE